ncbi:hypothetical protein PoB_001659500 [Plakobranchus ocellatus]|uniref:Uncharacterized protein n=1 Tax=Plakobranchus ocellatus TaxID=259542 RepID=A0AAV3Z4M6_9GAST|nr:hypothetical protein PoB_001659500 [Plakobranchus ocellatus]
MEVCSASSPQRMKPTLTLAKARHLGRGHMTRFRRYSHVFDLFFYRLWSACIFAAFFLQRSPLESECLKCPALAATDFWTRLTLRWTARKTNKRRPGGKG